MTNANGLSSLQCYRRWVVPPFRRRDGQEALDLQAEQPADVILTDLMMPRMDGFELLRKLEERGDRTPTIVLTGFGSIEKAIRSGA